MMTHDKYNQLVPDSLIDTFYKKIKEAENTYTKERYIKNLKRVNGDKVPEHIQKLLEDNNGDRFGVLMMNFDCDIAQWNNLLGRDIVQEDLHELGIPKDPHTTILFGFLSEIKKDDIKDHMTDKCIFIDDIEFSGISLFEKDEYDVLKLDLTSEKLNEYNQYFKDNFPWESDTPNFEPHVTLAYLKKGKGKYYTSGFNGKEMMLFTSNILKESNSLYYTYSDSKNNKSIFRIKCD